MTVRKIAEADFNFDNGENNQAYLERRDESLVFILRTEDDEYKMARFRWHKLGFLVLSRHLEISP